MTHSQRAVAPSYTIDIVPVIRHCLFARRRDIVKDLVVTGVLITAAVNSPPLIGVMMPAYGLACVTRAWILATRRQPQRAAALAILGLALIAAALVAGTVLDPASVLNPLTGLRRSIEVLALAGAAIWGICLAERLIRHQRIVDECGARRFRPDRAPQEPARHRARLEYLQQAQQGNVTVYARSARARPLVGHGALEASWSIATPLTRRPEVDPHEGADRFDGTDRLSLKATADQDLTLAAAYSALRIALVQLSDPRAEDRCRIQGLSLQDRLFVSGLLPWDHPLIDPATRTPRFRLDRDDMVAIAERDRDVSTYYLTVRITAWGGELEVTAFVYLSLRGTMLYVEFLGAALPSIKESFRAVDAFEKVDAVLAARSALASLVDVPLTAATAPVSLTDPLFDALAARLDGRSRAHAARGGAGLDVGATCGVRELSAQPRGQDFFQTLDAHRYISVVERRVIDAVAEVLESFGYSTTDLRRCATTIMDRGTHDVGRPEVGRATGRFGRGAPRRERHGAVPGQYTDGFGSPLGGAGQRGRHQ